MKRIAVLLSILALSFVQVSAQNSMLGGRTENSPEINADGSVTFRYYAPKAVTVQLRGDFFPKTQMETAYGSFEVSPYVDMKEGPDGVWSYTTEPLSPEFYSYLFVVDGRPIIDPSNIYMTRDINVYANCFIISKEKGDKGDLYSVNDVPHGTVSKVWYDSPTLKMTRRMTIYTPPGYNPRGKKSYPVMYLCHGGGNDEDAWQTQGRACQIIDNLIASGKIVPMIVVMPNGNAVQEAAPGESHKGLVQPDMSESGAEGVATIQEAFPDVVRYVDSNYLTIKNKKGRAMCGLSMGGYQTFYTSMMNPEMFGYLGLFSPGPLIDWDSPVPAFDQFVANTEIVSGLKTVFSKKPYLYWMGIGTEDPHYSDIIGLKKYMDTCNYPYTYFETSGAHEWRVWREHLTQFTQLIFK